MFTRTDGDDGENSAGKKKKKKKKKKGRESIARYFGRAVKNILSFYRFVFVVLNSNI